MGEDGKKERPKDGMDRAQSVSVKINLWPQFLKK